MTTRETQVHRAYLALLVAVLDDKCDARVHDILCVADDPHLALEVAHYAAHEMVGSIRPEDHVEMRADVAAELFMLAAGDADT